MKPTPEEPLDLGAEDRELVERLAASFRPAPFAASERAAFDAALADRIHRRQARRRWIGLGWLPAAAAAALVGVWLVTGYGAAPVWLVTGYGAAPPPAPDTRGALFPAQAWEEEVLLLDASFESEAEADLQIFPEEYLAIESAML
jgi:hypothetical protein